jgi:hypothetical protein
LIRGILQDLQWCKQIGICLHHWRL